MRVHDFLGFPSLQEVECSGGILNADLDLLSLTLFSTADSTVLATLNTFKGTCKTFSEFSSCDLNVGDTRKSSVRTLVADLEQGETMIMGCNVTSFLENGHAQMYTWSLPVYRKRKWSRAYVCECCSYMFTVWFAYNYVCAIEYCLSLKLDGFGCSLHKLSVDVSVKLLLPLYRIIDVPFIVIPTGDLFPFPGTLWHFVT